MTDANNSLIAIHAGQIKKAVEAIAINPKTGKVTLLTRKLFNVLLYLAQQQGDDQPIYRAPLTEITSNASFDSKDTFLIKEHLRKMNQIQVEWSSTSQDGNRRWGVTNILSEAEIIEDPSTHRTWVEWSYSPKIKKRLLEPEIYARLSLQFQSALRSSASLALYEICSRYTTSPNNLTMRQPWEWWRPILTGVPDGSGEVLAEFKYFSRDVLKPAVAEINSVTDINIELIQHKSGRKIVAIQFRAKRKAQAGLPLSDPGLFDMSLVSKMMSLGLARREVEQIYVETEENLIRAALTAVETRQRSKSQPKLENPGAWFKTALKSGLTKVPALQTKPVTKPRITKEKLREKYVTNQRNEARAMFSEMQDADRAEREGRFKAFLEADGNDVVMREFKKKGLKSKIAETAFFAWMASDTWGDPSENDLLEFVLAGGGEAA